MSIIEKRILDPSFAYLQPYFYTNPFALRCELGKGDTRETYLATARDRAERIHEILFPRGADAILFNYWIYDWSDSGPADRDGPDDTERILRDEQRNLRFLLDCMREYRHVSVRGLKTYDEPGDPEYGLTRRNRIVCYSDGKGFRDLELLDGQIRSDRNPEVSLVSFENECILSVYDDRGCDVVFASYEKMREFYRLLRPFFLDYDLEEMERRLSSGPGAEK